MPLLGEVEHEAPSIVKDIVDGNWLASVQQMQLSLRPIRTFAIVRMTMGSFISEGYYIGYPGRIIRPDKANTDPVAKMRRKDEYALDCLIRAAVQTDDIIEEWARNLGRKVQTDVRCNGALIQEAISWLQGKYSVPGTELQDIDTGPFRTACGIWHPSSCRC
eukprot:2480530-Pyramimonas_sp.AAC.1